MLSVRALWRADGGGWCEVWKEVVGRLMGRKTCREAGEGEVRDEVDGCGSWGCGQSRVAKHVILHARIADLHFRFAADRFEPAWLRQNRTYR